MMSSCEVSTNQPLCPQRVVVLGHETINSPIYTQLDPNQCHVMTEFLNRYTLIGESVPGGRALKIYRLAAFAPVMPPSIDYSIRVYVVEDTIDALDVSRTHHGGQSLPRIGAGWPRMGKSETF